MIRQISLAALTVTIAASTALADDQQPIASVMTSIHIDAGQRAGEISDVNGSIHIGENAIVGNVHDVNGSVHVDQGATAASLTTVNGSLHIGPGVRVTNDVHTVNGSIMAEPGLEVAGSLSALNGSLTLSSGHVAGDVANLNGTIRILGSHVGGNVSGANGGIEIGANSRVDGSLHVHKMESNGWFNWWNLFSFSRSPPRIVIGPGAVVSGPLVFEQEVKLYVSDRATVGPIQGATAIRFSGATPPE
jgi:cytoskeletal protein CcmA (bactofilin family)